MTIAEQVKSLREARGYTQAQLADLADISTDHLAEIEQYKVLPKMKLLQKLCDVLGVTFQDFSANIDGIETFHDPYTLFRAELCRLTPDQRKTLLAFLKTL